MVKSKKQFYRNAPHKDIYKYSLSTKGQQVLWNPSSLTGNIRWVAELPISLFHIGNISGLKYENDKKTKVTIEYVELRDKSPFSVLVRSDNKSNIIKRKVTLELYDDGWRVTTTTKAEKKLKRKPLKDIIGWEHAFKNYSVKK